MGFVKEFKEFASKGNVVDMAVGIIIGAGFGKIVSSLVADVIMPPIGIIVGGIDFTGLKLVLKEGAGATPAVTLNYGNFLQTTIDFLIVAFSVFLVVKAINRIKKKAAEELQPTPAQTQEEKLLTEIRDILKSSPESWKKAG